MHPADIAAENRERQGKMEHLQAAIQHTHMAMEEISDASQVSRLAAALNTLTSVQEQSHRVYQGPQRFTDGG